MSGSPPTHPPILAEARSSSSRTVMFLPRGSCSASAWASRRRLTSSTTFSALSRWCSALRHCQATPARPPPSASTTSAAGGGQRRIAAAPHRRSHGHPDRPGLDRLAVEPSCQVFGQRQGTGIPSARLLLQALLADDLQVARHPGIEPRGGLGRLAAHLVERLDQRGPGERRPAREQGVQDRAQAIDIRRRRERAPGPGSPAPAPCTTGSRSGRPSGSSRSRRRSAWPVRSP